MTIQLRDYQEKAVADIREAMRQHRRVLLQSPTGSGKTEIFSYVTNGAARKQKRVYIIAHRAEILRQISAAIGRYNLPHGWIAPGRSPTDDLCQIGMVQTLARRYEKLPAPDMLIVDEAHHAAKGGQYNDIISAWPQAFVFGVTATPQRLDGRGLGDSFDRLILGPSTRELIERVFLANYTYLAPQLASFDGVKTRMGDYVSDAIAEIMDKPTITGSAIAEYKKYLDGKTAIAFCISVAHAEHVAQQFRDAGIPAASIDGKMLPHERQRICDALASGRIKVMPSCELVSEGFDAPSVNGCIMLRPTKSLAMVLQMVGRVLRLKPDGSNAIILDHVANYKEHGMPDTPRVWTLDGKKKKKEEFRTKKCELCFRVFEVKKDWQKSVECDDRGEPECAVSTVVKDAGMGEGRAIEEVDGELHEITETPAWAGGINIMRASGDEWRAMVERADTREKLLQISRMRGYKKGWVAHVMKSRSAPHDRNV